MRCCHSTRAAVRPLAASLVAAWALAAATVTTLATAPAAGAQPADSATVTIVARRDSAPLADVRVRVLGLPLGGATDGSGRLVLRVPAGDRALVAARLGFVPDTLRVALRAGQDTTLAVRLAGAAADVEAIVVTATRAERRVEDTPIRVEVIDEEEVAEKVSMTPGDIAMMLNETSGLRVQATNPSLGGASVRVQGLRGRYTLLLADGLPLYGGQAGGLGLLQIPPVDLGRVEIVKGSASALYGSSALGGVVDLVSRRPGEEGERTLLVNGTTRGGADGVFFGAAPLGARWGYTLLAGAHAQRRNDLDGDGWTDMPGYERAVVRPRLFYSSGGGTTAFVTGGFTGEGRDGGTLSGRFAPDGRPYDESLRTRRADVGFVARRVLGGPSGAEAFGTEASGTNASGTNASGTNAFGVDQPRGGLLRGAIASVRASANTQRHRHQFGSVRERDRHTTWFGEASLAVPRGAATYVLGAALQQETYRARDVAGFDYRYTIPAAFAQADVDAASWLALSASARVDAHSAYGTFVNPRLSLLARLGAGWTSRLSGGTGAFAPTPFTEETEVTGLAPLAPLAGLRAERARSASLDVGGPLATPFGALELNATAFGSTIAHALQLRAAGGVTPAGASRVLLANADGRTRTWGGELLARLVHEVGDGRAARVTATYTYLRATECDPDAARGPAPSSATDASCARRAVPLNPRHAVGLVGSVEHEGVSRVGVELYHTGRQTLEDDPYRALSRPYLVVGVLAERQFGAVRAFVNAENLGDVRQTRVDPLVLRARGEGGRWTTPVWSLLEGRTVNGGVRMTW